MLMTCGVSLSSVISAWYARLSASLTALRRPHEIPEPRASRLQGLVCPLVDDRSRLEHMDYVAILQRHEPVRDHDDGLLVAERVDRFDYCIFGLRIDRARGLVEDQDFRIVIEGAGGAPP